MSIGLPVVGNKVCVLMKHSQVKDHTRCSEHRTVMYNGHSVLNMGKSWSTTDI